MKKPLGAATTTTTATTAKSSLPQPPSTPPQLAVLPSNKSTGWAWAPLSLPQSELALPLTFPTGQTFRWKLTAPVQYTGTLGPHLISLSHQNDAIFYHIHRSPSPSAAKSALLDFLNASFSLSDLHSHFSSSDPRFAALAPYLQGARVLRQDPVECLIQFLCSSNNNIARITKMVDYVSSLGDYLGNVEGFQFHEFPSLERLGLVTEEQFRKAGFGYRAKYITGTVEALRGKPGGGAKWLASLRECDLDVVIESLCTLPGVGPKVASCIALFSLDQHHAIPVDTHVWKIATTCLLPELANARPSPKLCNRVADAFVSKYGKYAGWAQTLLFIAQLPPQKALLPSHLANVIEIESSNKKRKKHTKW